MAGLGLGGPRRRPAGLRACLTSRPSRSSRDASGRAAWPGAPDSDPPGTPPRPRDRCGSCGSRRAVRTRRSAGAPPRGSRPRTARPCARSPAPARRGSPCGSCARRGCRAAPRPCPAGRARSASWAPRGWRAPAPGGAAARALRCGSWPPGPLRFAPAPGRPGAPPAARPAPRPRPRPASASAAACRSRRRAHSPPPPRRGSGRAGPSGRRCRDRWCAWTSPAPPPWRSARHRLGGFAAAPG